MTFLDGTRNSASADTVLVHIPTPVHTAVRDLATTV